MLTHVIRYMYFICSHQMVYNGDPYTSILNFPLSQCSWQWHCFLAQVWKCIPARVKGNHTSKQDSLAVQFNYFHLLTVANTHQCVWPGFCQTHTLYSHIREVLQDDPGRMEGISTVLSWFSFQSRMWPTSFWDTWNSSQFLTADSSSIRMEYGRCSEP